jgi:hypothetical protein
LVIGYDYLNLPKSIFTYVYKGLKKLDGDITFVSAGLFTLHNSWPAVLLSAYLQINRTKINVLNINVLQINGSLHQQKFVEV